jgi:DNA-binding CsgD family transcriptional regulator/tetratricopeptide (TPR) repeat protein
LSLDTSNLARVRLVGRAKEQRVVDALLYGARRGLSAALVVRADPGMGKTALLEYMVESATDFQVLRVSGVESEMELGFAALDQLCRPLADRFDRLPDPQAAALAVSFGHRNGESPDRFLVGLGVLTLLSDLADEGPVLCVVDDAQWLDQASAQVLGFVGRRLEAESVVLVIGCRASDDRTELSGLEVLSLGRLSDADAQELLGSALAGGFDPAVRDRIVAEAQGNPLALLELPRSAVASELAGGFGVPDGAAVSGRVEASFRRRIQRLPMQTQRLLLVAAAEPHGDPDLLRAAAGRLGLRADASAPAEAAGLLRVRERVVFRHPLVRSAVYGSAVDRDRRAVHQALAEATDPESDPDRRAWHRAAAAVEPDEEVAAELERSAERAHARGGQAAAAAFLERAAALTPDRARRAKRALAAARAKLIAGSSEAARRLAAMAEAGPLDPLDGARVEVLQAQTALYPTYRPEAPRLLVQAARRLAPLDAALSRETYLEALDAATSAGRLGEEGGLRRAAAAALAAPPAPEPPRPVDVLLDGRATRLVEGAAAGFPKLKQALAALHSDPDIRFFWLRLAMISAQDVGNDDTWQMLANREVQVARKTGSLTSLPGALEHLALLNTFAGHFDDAAATIEEANAIGSAIGAASRRYAPLFLAGWRGRLHETTTLIDNALRYASAAGEGLIITNAEYAEGIQRMGLGHYEMALEASLKAAEHGEGTIFWLSLLDVIEAAVRTNKPHVAVSALEQLSTITRASGTEWALGVEARSRALVCEDRQEAESLYGEAIERLGRTTIAVDLARAHLLYGEWLRRERRRTDARQHLQRAYDMFSAMGAEAFADRVAGELQATGARRRKRSVQTAPQLTPQQAQVALLASQGHTNLQIGAQLFISPKTVEHHLRGVFAVLDITSRAQLAGALEKSKASGAGSKIAATPRQFPR